MPDFLWKVIGLLIPMLITAIQTLIDHDKFVKFGDKVLDWAERAIQEKPNWYDEYALELIKIVREALAIPDLPDEPTE